MTSLLTQFYFSPSLKQPQDPAYYGGEMLASTKRALETRYTLLPYLYTLFVKAHLTGSPVVHALSHVYVFIDMS